MNKIYNRKDFSQHKNFCLYPFTQLYCLSTPDGFRVKPCCETLEKDEMYTKMISSIKNHDFLKPCGFRQLNSICSAPKKGIFVKNMFYLGF